MSSVLPAERDTRARWQRMLPVLGVGAAGLASAIVVTLVDPNDGHYPSCPTQTLLGVDCPGCGGLRSAHALLRGDVVSAADHNLAALALIPAAVLAFVWWARRSWRGWSPAITMTQFRRRNRLLLIAVAALMLFGVVRNVVPYLGSGLGSG